MSWARLDGTDGRLFVSSWVGDRYRVVCVGPDMTAGAANCLVGTWVVRDFVMRVLGQT